MRYRAFISYASADRAIGERFQRAIEHYRIPKALRGSDRGAGPTPKYLTPIFRDRSDADVGKSLSAVLEDALERSDALVVLCSPTAARSKWVNLEIQRFTALGRGTRIFPVVVAGTPAKYDPDRAPDGAFPPALFDRDAEPLAADIRPTGDGFDLARLKIVAKLTNIPLTELTQRQLEAERRDRRIVRTVAGVMAALAIVAGIAAVVAAYSADNARTQLSNSIEMAARRVDAGAKYGDRYGVPIEVIRELLTGAEEDFRTLIGEQDTGVPMLELQRGRLLVLFSGLYEKLGQPTEQLARARVALQTLERVPARRRLTAPSTWLATLPSAHDLTSEQLGAMEALAVALGGAKDGDAEALSVLESGRERAVREARPDFVARFWARLGEHHYNRGDLAKARAAHDAAIAALDTHLGKEAGTAPSAERAATLSDRAQLLFESGRAQEALADQQKVIDILDRLEKASPSDNSVLQSLGQALTRHADARYAATNTWDVSIPEYRRALDVFERAHASDPTRIDYARNLSVALERFGDVMLQIGDLASARTAFDRMVALRRGRVSRDPSSGEARRDLAVALERHGDLARAAKNRDGALKFYEEARELRTAAGDHTASDPILTRDLAVLWYKLGSTRAEASPATTAWRDALNTAIALMTPLVDRENAPPGWLRDVAIFHYAYGEALTKTGRAAEARTHWTTALEAIDRQLAIEKDNPQLLRDKEDLLARLGPKK
jgi:tetratricopeptide (TPR) repeat protein